jgi:hypothetical protein
MLLLHYLAQNPAQGNQHNTIIICGEAPITTTMATLGPWDQAASRSYMKLALCFPFDDKCSAAELGQRKDDVQHHLQAALNRLSKQWPKLTGSLQLDQSEGQTGRLVYHRASESAGIPLALFEPGDKFPVTYSQLRDSGFQPGTFVHINFIPDEQLRPSEPIPTSSVRVSFVSGGLVLWVFLHHSIGDGWTFSNLINAFGASTRGITLDLLPDLPLHNIPHGATLYEASTMLESQAACPEYCLLSDPTGPGGPRLMTGGSPMNEYKKTGKIFVFKQERLDELLELMNSLGSTSKKLSRYVCLGILTWVHVAMTRITRENPGYPSEDAKPFTPFDWAWRVLGQKTKDMGNMVGIVLTQIPFSELSHPRNDPEVLSRIARSLAMALGSVTLDWVEARRNFINSIQDPRFIGISHDPRQAQELAFNTWQFVGRDATWDIPWVPVNVPDAMRRIQGEWNMAGANVMPARPNSTNWELLITIPKCSMDALEEDEEWMKWVYQIIDEDGIYNIAHTK